MNRAHGFIIALAIGMTLLNVVKPITADDAAYVQFARQIAEHPLDPYGFQFDGVQPANTVLAPPVFLYWFGLGVRLFGENVLLWKLWLLPVCWLFLQCLYHLGARFAPGLEKPFVLMVGLSPTILPCINLMLDLPVLAIGLASLVLFLRACDHDSFRAALLSGLVAGLAMQTKYTAFLIPPLMVWYALLFSKKRLALVACTIPLILFVAWEALTAWKYGDSHFLLGRAQFREPFARKLNFALPLLGYLGATASAGIVLALAALGRRRLGPVAAILVSAQLLFVLVPSSSHVLWATASGRPVLTLNHALYGSAGAVLLILGGCVAIRLLRNDGGERRIELFLLCWLALELAGYFVLSPYPATRRIMGLVLVGTLLGFRLGRLTCQTAEQHVWLWRTVALNCGFAMYCFVIDFNVYHGQRELAQAIARSLGAEMPRARVWHVSNSAFSFYGEQADMTRLNSGVELQSGDLVCVPEGHEQNFEARLAGRPRELHSTWTWTAYLPIRSRFQYGNVAFERIDGPLISVRVFRISPHQSPPPANYSAAAP